MHMSFRIRQLLIGACLLSACLLTGCEKSTVAVNLHGVNYSGQEFSYYVADPATPNSVAGEHIDQFAAGGTTCCFPLPRKWRPGIKVEIRTTHWLPKLPDGSLPEVNEVHMVDVPRYPDGSPGELWVIRAADGSLSVVSSDFQPDHDRWPGKLKGWPVPSLEYKIERWKLIKEHQEIFVRTYRSLLSELAKSPQVGANMAWETAREYEPASIKGFTGPDDPRYIIALKKDYKKALNECEEELKKIMEQRP